MNLKNSDCWVMKVTTSKSEWSPYVCTVKVLINGENVIVYLYSFIMFYSTRHEKTSLNVTSRTCTELCAAEKPEVNSNSTKQVCLPLSGRLLQLPKQSHLSGKIRPVQTCRE